MQCAPSHPSQSRRIALALCAVAGLGAFAAGHADARDVKPFWGTAYIDDNPFLDPSTRQLLPAGKSVPRGWILDSYTDDHRVRMKVTAYSTAGAAVSSYYVDERNGVKVSFDRALDVTPTALGSIGYQLCRQIGETGTPECVAQIRLARPVPPAPPAAPAPVVPTTTAPATTTAPPSSSVPEPVTTAVPPATAPAIAPELIVVPPAADAGQPRGCVPQGQPIRFRLKLKQTAAAKRTKILKVTFYLTRRGKHVVDRQAPYGAKLPVKARPGATTIGYAKIRYRVAGRGTFEHKENKRFKICP